ncbi:hypothetical protein GPECTOR_34g770 [Gonium pectorale]|uniref:Protein kinase domain-containing protein n=1 Tax=Gonium pectorale TaxID=33097 RepID=A0A150GCN0_GONPE|nr:hypothetical protein GPECTOR_34g770 [Gonium pectorale]|eukprot:KXZ47611.1 hypothetical protein GPECTOR_34g770 [Gonium pectorale]
MIIMTSNIFLVDGDRVVLRRNVTVLGAFAEREQYPLLDMGFVRGRIQLMRVCLPSSQSDASMQTWQRPPEIAGSGQVSIPRVAQSPDCDNSTSSPPLKRCWAAVGLNVDLGLYGSYIDEYGKPVLNDYLLWVHDTCELEMSQGCVAQYGAVGCYHLMTGGMREAGGAAVSTADRSTCRPVGQASTDKDARGVVTAPASLSTDAAASDHSARAFAVADVARFNLKALAAEPDTAPVTPATPTAPDVNLDLDLTNPGDGSGSAPDELRLLPASCLGTGASGRVVVGVYRGQHVAVKLLHAGLVDLAALATPPPVEAGSGVEPGAAGVSQLEGAEEAWAAAGAAMQEEEGEAERLKASAAPHTVDVAGRPPGASPPGSSTSAAASRHRGATSPMSQPLPPSASPEQTSPERPLPEQEQHDVLTGGDPGVAASRTFAQEVAVLARVRHPNVIRLLAACLRPPRPCLVMELMDTSLEKMLYGDADTERGRQLPLDTVLHIATQMAQALAYLHPTVMHRDLKPANVLISQPSSATPVAKLAVRGARGRGLAGHGRTYARTHAPYRTVPYSASGFVSSFAPPFRGCI